jgi:hypothetical protein
MGRDTFCGSWKRNKKSSLNVQGAFDVKSDEKPSFFR